LAKGIPSRWREFDELFQPREDRNAEDGVNHTKDHHANLREDKLQGSG
jgi:hypothetical protein